MPPNLTVFVSAVTTRGMELDETDREILEILQEDARTPFSEVARRIEMSSATVHDRVNRLVDEDVIEGYHASVDPKALGYDVRAIVGLRVKQGREQDTLDQLAKIDGVQEVHITTGEYDVVMWINATDTEDLRRLMFDRIARMDGFSRSETMVVLGTTHDDEVLSVLDEFED
jgi:Lrp/AsnC family transcriptional regulator for asnA, asnC and gidA